MMQRSWRSRVRLGPARTGAGVAPTLALTVALTAGCVSGPERNPLPLQPAPSGPSAAGPASVSHAMPDDVVRMLFPATGRESRWAQGLDAFGQQIGHAVARSCARSHGAAAPEGPPPTFIRLSDLPDLAFIRRHGFTTSAEVPLPDPAAGSPAPARDAARQEPRRCEASARAAVKRFRELYAPLQRRWWRRIAAVRDEPRVARALEELPGCLDRHGAPAGSEDAFFALVDTRLQRSDSPAAADRTDRRLGAGYAACMEPVEAVRRPLRRQLRQEFTARHAQQTARVRQHLVPEIRRLERRHGIRISFPVP